MEATGKTRPAIEMVSSAPAPQLDECIRSYLARATRMQAGCAPDANLMGAMDALLASIGTKNEQALVEGHSYIGYLRFVSQGHAGIPIHRHTDWRTLSGLLRTPSRRQRLCPTCIEHDLSTEGIAYARRKHQLIGTVVCGVHGDVLVPRSVDVPLTRQPAGGLPDAAAHRAMRAAASPLVQRYTRLSELALGSKVPRSPSSMVTALVQRARTRGVRVTPEGRGHRLSDLARDSAPSDWLAEHFQAVFTTEPGTHSPALDGVLRARHVAHRTASYLLAMALLWDDPAEAMTACEGAATPNRVQSPCDGALRALQGILDGQSIPSACKRERTTLAALADAIRKSAGSGWNLTVSGQGSHVD